MRIFKPPFKHWSYLADLVVIILGIVIALSLDAWWQNKQDRKLEQHYLEKLYVEFKANEHNFEKSLHDHVRKQGYAKTVLRVIHDGLDIPTDSIGHLVNWASKGSPDAIIDGNYKALIQSGHLSLITNDSLRSKLAAYGGRVAVDMNKLLIWSENANTRWSYPFFMEEWVDLTVTPDRNYTGIEGMPANNRFPIDYAILLNDRRFNSFVLLVHEDRVNTARFTRRILGLTTEIKKLLETELKIKPVESSKRD